jgi:hypothetical protein
MVNDADLIGALRRQWGRIAAASKDLDVDASSRVDGWRNAEVLAHLAIQPVLLGHFLGGASSGGASSGPPEPTMGLEDNLAGTHALAETIDAAARKGAHAGRIDFAQQVAALDAVLMAADINATVTTLQDQHGWRTICGPGASRPSFTARICNHP